MTEEHTQQEVCPHCGGTHLDKELTMTFKGSLVHAIETMAERRNESVEQFIFHLLSDPTCGADPPGLPGRVQRPWCK